MKKSQELKKINRKTNGLKLPDYGGCNRGTLAKWLNDQIYLFNDNFILLSCVAIALLSSQ